MLTAKISSVFITTLTCLENVNQMEPMEILFIVVFGMIGLGSGIGCWYRQFKKSTMKPSPSRENLSEDPIPI